MKQNQPDNSETNFVDNIFTQLFMFDKLKN